MEQRRRGDTKAAEGSKLLNIGASHPLRAFAPSLCLLLSALTSHAAPPSLETLFPCGAKVGATTTITATGSNLEKGHPSVWTDHPGIVFKPGEKPKTFSATIAPEVPLGPHLIRFYNAEGASGPHVFVIGKHGELTDTEPNDDHLKPQTVAKIPVTVHGRLEKNGDVDTFAVTLEAGRTFTAEVQGYALGSQMDPALKLLDSRGVEVALSHDTHNLDPLLRHEVKASGTYFVQLMAFAHPPAADVSLKGSSAHIYRLTLTDQPFALSASPSAITRGQSSELTVLKAETTVDATRSLASDDRITVPAPSGEPVYAALVTPSVSLETEPNNDAKSAQRLTAPFAVSGVISPGTDEDRFVFSAKKGDSLSLRVHAASIHSPMDASLRVEDSSGKVLQQSDDSDNSDRDPAVTLRAAADGDHVAIVSDLFQRGDSDYCYILEVAPPLPRVTATLAANALKLEAGKAAELKATVKITGKLEGKLTATVTGLPTGVTTKEVEVPAKGGEAKLTLTAAPDAAAADVPIELQLTADNAISKAAYDLRGTEPRGDRLINDDSRVWLTVTPKK
jgi:hypothetical protein